MKTSKTLYSTVFSDYSLTKTELNKLHSTLLKMLVDFDSMCKKENINYSLSGGTLLGAIRHKGFIPWDDDIDVMMTRENYEKFKECCDYKNKYILAEPITTLGYIGKMVKLYKKGTEYIEISAIKYPMPQMVYLDIFIIENAPSSKISIKMRSLVHDFCFKASSLCLDYKYPSPLVLKRCDKNKELKKYFNLRRRLGCIFAHFGGHNLYYKFLNRLEIYRKKTGLMCIPSAISYSREVFPEKIYTSTMNGIFCGHKVKVIKNYDVYLKNLYGEEYMKLPPENKRETHTVYKCEC